MKRSRVYGAEIDYIKDKLMTTTSTSMSLADESNNYNNTSRTIGPAPPNHNLASG